MTDGYLVTGTDAGVGTTTICCALLELARQRGRRTAAIKPIATGCNDQGHSVDADALLEAMSEPLSYQQVNPVALVPVGAPHIAAAQSGRRLQASRLAGYCQGVLQGGADLVLVDGIGGWRVPINHRETLADLARELGLPVILVVGVRPGCINHALLTAEAIRRDGLVLAGWVANAVGPQLSYDRENLDTLRSSLGSPLLGEVPRLTSTLPSIIATYLDLPTDKR